MIKVYRLNNVRMNSMHIILKGKSGNSVIYEFENGNVMNNTPARCTLTGKYEQDLLESNEAFKNRTIVLDKVFLTDEEVKAKEEAEKKAQEAAQPVAEETVAGEESAIMVEPNIKTVAEACNYVAEHFGVKCVKAAQAKAVALQNGVDFVNLKIGKKA